MRNDPVLQPFDLRGVHLRNRIISTAHEPAFAVDGGMPGDRYRAYHVEKARGGIGLTMIGGSACVSVDSAAAFGNIDMSTDRVVPYLAKLAEECHQEGAAVMIQLTHLGARSSNYTDSGLPLIAPSRYREPVHRAFAKEAESADLDRVVSDFASAARRVKDAGLDGLEVFHSGHLLDSFVSPWINNRDDEYGGSLENRMRMPIRVIDAVRAAVGDDFCVGIRMTMDEDHIDGIDEPMALEALRGYIDHGIDFLNLNHGTLETDAALAAYIPGMGTPSAPHLDLCGRVRAAIDIPIMHAARITDIATARYALENDLVDLVGMTRPQLADPYLVSKVAAGHEDDVRPCVGANACLDAIYTSGAAQCIHNPASGRELTLPQEIETLPLREHRNVVVIGAGPAGLEAARVAASRGHTTTVFEAGPTHGGQVAIAARSARRAELIGIVDWRRQQAEKHGAKLMFNTFADADLVRSYAPDVVIVATGGLPDTDLCDGCDEALDVWDVMTAPAPTGTVLVYDDNGSYPALDAVETLALAGARVIYATPERTIAAEVGSMNSPAYLDVFGRYGVDTRMTTRLAAITPCDGAADCRALRARLQHEYSGTSEVLDVDAVVVEHGTLPNDELYLELRADSSNGGQVAPATMMDPLGHRSAAPGADEEGYRLYRIGDAVNSRNVHSAVLDALRVGLLV